MGSYKIMDKESIIDYIKDLEIFPKDHKLESKEVRIGKLKHIFKIIDIDNNKSIIVKQAIPYKKLYGDSFKHAFERSRIECEALKCQDKVFPGSVPNIYYHDNEQCVIMMENLEDMDILRYGLMDMQDYPNFPKQIGMYMARNLFMTSDYGMGTIEKKKNLEKFISPELCDMAEKLVFTNPYYDSEDNVINDYIKLFVEKEIWNCEELRTQTAELKEVFMTKYEALLHGNLHTGSIFINNNKTIVFNPEFAFYGPYGYDIGLLFANIFLNYISWDGRFDKRESAKKTYKRYLLVLCSCIWNEFVRELDLLWNSKSKDITTKNHNYESAYIKNLLHEAVGFCSCEIMRRIIGSGHVPDLDCIKDLKVRGEVEKHGLRIAKSLILNRNKIDNFYTVIELVEECK